MENGVALAAIALAATICTGFFALLAGALKDLTRSNERIADEAKARNGHLGDQSIHLATLVSQQNKDIAKIANTLSKSALIAAEDRDILTGGNQVVHEQTVERQIINGKEEK